jgi:hypothetical protein
MAEKPSPSTIPSNSWAIPNLQNAYCCPDFVSNALSSLLSIFDELQGNDKPIVAFWSRFDSLILEMARCKVIIPPLLLLVVVLFLCPFTAVTSTSLSNSGLDTSL